MPHVEISLEELKRGVPVRIENGLAGILIYRTENAIQAFEDSCPHAKWRLSDGAVCAGVLECPGHGWEFDIETGQCLKVPAYQLRRYAVIVAGGLVRISWEDPMPQNALMSAGARVQSQP